MSTPAPQSPLASRHPGLPWVIAAHGLRGLGLWYLLRDMLADYAPPPGQPLILPVSWLCSQARCKPTTLARIATTINDAGLASISIEGNTITLTHTSCADGSSCFSNKTTTTTPTAVNANASQVESCASPGNTPTAAPVDQDQDPEFPPLVFPPETSYIVRTAMAKRLANVEHEKAQAILDDLAVSHHVKKPVAWVERLARDPNYVPGDGVQVATRREEQKRAEARRAEIEARGPVYEVAEEILVSPPIPAYKRSWSASRPKATPGRKRLRQPPQRRRAMDGPRREPSRWCRNPQVRPRAG